MKTGLDHLRQTDFAPLHGKRVGLVTHPAAISGFDGERFVAPPRTVLELIAGHPAITLAALFGPEHGITGEAQDLIPVSADRRGSTPPSVKLYSLYGDTFESLKPTAAMLAGLAVLVIDLVDIGSRYYTFQATMLYCMEACAEVGVKVMILDRPNPIGTAREGPTIQPGFESFVGPHPIPTRHGLTMGQLAKLYQAERVPNVDLHVVECTVKEKRPLYPFALPPSPNMPTVNTALVYPGMCLIEGTNLSEGRGTTTPFELVGFPGANANELTQTLRDMNLPGVDFLPANYTPTFQKHAGQSCGGVRLVVTDPASFRPVETGTAVIVAFRNHLGNAFRWRTETYEFVSHIPAIDLLFGSDRERRAIEAGMPLREIVEPWQGEIEAFEKRIG